MEGIQLKMSTQMYKTINETVGIPQFVNNCNQICRIEQAFTDNRIFDDFHKLEGLEKLFVYWSQEQTNKHRDNKSLVLFERIVESLLYQKPITNAASTAWNDTMWSEAYVLLFSKIGLSPQKIRDLIYTTGNPADFMKELESYVTDKKTIIRKDVIDAVMPLCSLFHYQPTEENVLTILDNAFNLATSLYFFEDTLRFVVHTDCEFSNDVLEYIPDKIVENFSLDSFFYDMDDMMVDFQLNDQTYSSLTVRLENITDHVTIYDKNGKVMGESNHGKILTIYQVMEDDRFANYTQIFLFSDFLQQDKERVFVVQDFSDFKCEFQCQRINKCTIVRQDTNGKLPMEVCCLRKSKIESNRCICNIGHPFKVLALCSFIWDCYIHRNTIGKTQELRDEIYNQYKISIHLKSFERTDASVEDEILLLDQYSELERKNHKEGIVMAHKKDNAKIGEFNNLFTPEPILPTHAGRKHKFKLQ